MNEKINVKTTLLNDELRYLLKEKYKISNTDIRVLWEESDAFVYSFVNGKKKTINAGKFFTMVSNAKMKNLNDLYTDLLALIDKLVK